MDGDVRKVLIVDGDVLSVIQAEQVLGQAGYRVARLLSGAGFLAKLEYEQPDIVLLDTSTPGLQPEVIFERLQTRGYEDLVLVLFSAMDPEDLEQICIANESINGYFSKSIGIDQLPGFIESFFS